LERCRDSVQVEFVLLHAPDQREERGARSGERRADGAAGVDIGGGAEIGATFSFAVAAVADCPFPWRLELQRRLRRPMDGNHRVDFGRLRLQEP